MGAKHSCSVESCHGRCRHTSGKDLDKSPGNRFLIICLPGIQKGSGSFCSGLYDTVAKILSRQPACTENYDSELRTRRSIAEARIKCMSSISLPKQCFVSDDQLKSHKSEQESKVILEKHERVNASRSKWNESSQQLCWKKGRESLRIEYKKMKDTEPLADNDDSENVQRAHKRQEATKLRRKTRKLMAKEYAEVYTSEQHASIDAREKEWGHTSNEETTHKVCNEYRELTKTENRENDSYCTTLIENDWCLKTDKKYKLNVSKGVQGTDLERQRESLMQRKYKDVNTAVLLADNDTFDEDRKTHGKFSKPVAAVESKEQDKKKLMEMKKKLGQPITYTSLQAMAKLFLRLLVLLGMMSLVKTTSVAKRTNDESTQRIFSYDLLSTDVCSRTNFDRSQTCQLSGNQLKDTIRHCGFQAKCKKGDKARCVNTLQGGMAHICSSANLSCPEGIWRKAWIDTDNPDLVRVKEENCPNGTFQPYESNCYDACKATHLDTNDLPEKFIVYSKGNTNSPTYVYCNYKKGYFNLDYKTFLNYDQESEHNPYFCRHVDEVDQNCTEKKYPLPNGTCVSECMPGECRDDHDEFICKRNCSNKASDKDGYGNNAQQNEDVDECHENDDICKNGVCQNTYGSYICECSEGFMLDRKIGECIDLDECHGKDDICKNGVCQNTHGSYLCNCSEGFMLDREMGECIEKGKTRDKPSDMKDITIVLLSSIIPVFLFIGAVVIVLLHKRRRGQNAPTEDDTPSTSSDGITPSTSSISTTSDEKKSANGKLRPFNKVKKTKRNTSQHIEFQNDVNSVSIHYHNHGTEGVDQEKWKQTCKVDLNACDGRIDLLTEEGRIKNSETETGMPKTRLDAKDNNPACQVDATTPLLHEELGLDHVESKSPNERQEFLETCAVKTDADVLLKTERKDPIDEALEPLSGDGDDSDKVDSKHDTSLGDDVNNLDDENESNYNFEDVSCKAPLLGKPTVLTVPSTNSGHGNLQQQIVTTTDRCIERKNNAHDTNTSHVENVHVTQHNYLFTADELLKTLRRYRESSYQTKDSTITQIQSKDEPSYKGELFKKPFDNTFNQYAMELHTKLMESVGALVVKQKHVGTPRVAGTVFRIGDCSLMTARHVIKSIVDPDDSGNENWSLLESDDVYVNFNASLINEGRIQYRVKCTYISDDPDLDFAILQITNPRQLPLKMLLHQFEYARLNAKQLSIIGFGHTTQHNDKCIDPRCQILNPDSERMLDAKENVIAHKAEYLKAISSHTVGDSTNVDQCYSNIERKHNITVDCFMEHGASGAPAVSPCGKVVGILIEGLPALYFNLPDDEQKKFPSKYRFEIVLKMEYIYKYLKEKRPELAEMFF